MSLYVTDCYFMHTMSPELSNHVYLRVISVVIMYYGNMLFIYQVILLFVVVH